MADKPMSPETKVAVRAVLALFGAVLGTGIPAVYYLGQMSNRFESLEASQNDLQQTLEDVMHKDLHDVKKRITIMEQKDILPRAERQIQEMEVRLRELETGRE